MDKKAEQLECEKRLISIVKNSKKFASRKFSENFELIGDL